MSISKLIPTVENCCFYINLVDGCYFAAFYSIFGILDFSFGTLSTHISHCWDEDNSLQLFAGYFGYFMALVSIVIAVFSCIFIWGIRKNKPFTAVWFMCGMAAKTVGLIIFAAVLIAASTRDSDTECDSPIIKICLSIFYIALNIYLIIVVWNYYVKMLLSEETVPEAAPKEEVTADTPK